MRTIAIANSCFRVGDKKDNFYKLIFGIDTFNNT